MLEITRKDARTWNWTVNRPLAALHDDIDDPKAQPLPVVISARALYRQNGLDGRPSHNNERCAVTPQTCACRKGMFRLDVATPAPVQPPHQFNKFASLIRLVCNIVKRERERREDGRERERERERERGRERQNLRQLQSHRLNPTLKTIPRFWSWRQHQLTSMRSRSRSSRPTSSRRVREFLSS